MHVYILLYTLLLFCIFLDREDVPLFKKKQVLFFLITVFTLFRGLRWRNGTDWDQYYETFYGLDWNNMFAFQRYGDQELEFGYSLLNVIIKSMGGDYTAFLLITNFFILFSYYKYCVRFSPTPILVFVITLFCTTIFTVRLQIAAAVVLFSYQYIIDKSFIKFAVVVLLASTIHTSSLVFLPFYFILPRRTSVYAALAIFGLTIILSNPSLQQAIIGFLASKATFMGSMVTSRLNAYMELTKQTINYRNSYLSKIIFVFFLVIFSIYREREEHKNSVIFNINYNAFVAYFVITEFFRESMDQFVRLFSFFIFGFPFLLAIVISDYGFNRHARVAVLTLFIGYMYYKIYTTITFGYPELHIPYRTVFD